MGEGLFCLCEFDFRRSGVSPTLALAIHERQLAEHGGSAGVRDETLLESALAHPQQLWAYGDPPPDLAALAASLAYGLAHNHPFVDGNKRTAHIYYRVFLALNDARLEANAAEMYATMIGLAEGSLPETDFADWLRPHLRLETRDAVHEPASHGA
jgi:death-on-curing protein